MIGHQDSLSMVLPGVVLFEKNVSTVGMVTLWILLVKLFLVVSTGFITSFSTCKTRLEKRPSKNWQESLFSSASRCPFAGGGGHSTIGKNNHLSLCPFAARGRTRNPNKRTIVQRMAVRPFAVVRSWQSNDDDDDDDSQHDDPTPSPKKTFWEIYQTIASEQQGLFCEWIITDSDDNNSMLSNTPKLKAMVALAEHEAADRYAMENSDTYRAWLAEKLECLEEGGNLLLLDELHRLGRRSEMKLVLGACVYLRHSWHQGNPNVEPVPTIDVVDSHGRVVKEPRALHLAVEFVANRLGVAPYFNVYSWLFCNWKWTPTADSARDIDFPGDLTYEKMCDLTKGSLSPRFYWLTGAAKESEANFWRAFAYSELMAVPMYGEIGKILDQVRDFDISVSHRVTSSPSGQSVEKVLSSLNVVRQVTRNITAALVAYGNSDLIDAKHFVQMQYTAHYAGTSAGASGFQAPCMVMLDTLLGVDYTSLSTDLQQTRQENIDEMLPEVVDLIFGVVHPGAKALRRFIQEIACDHLRRRAQTSFNSVVDELILWRSSHRSRAGKYVEASTVTTGRTNDDMGGNVHRTFLNEMSSIIFATKATKYPDE